MIIKLDQYFYYLSIVLMASVFLPLVFNNLPPLIRSFHLWSLIWITSLLIFKSPLFFTKIMALIFMYGIYLTAFILITGNNLDDWNKNMLIREYYNIFISISVLIYYIKEKKYYYFSKLIKWSLLFIGVTAVMTIISSIVDHAYARNLASLTSSVISQDERQYYMIFNILGGGNYSTAIAFMCLAPMLVFVFKYYQKQNRLKYSTLTIIVLILIATFRMQIFTNIFLISIFTILAFIGYPTTKKSFFVSIFIILLLIVPIESYLVAIRAMGELFHGSAIISEKFFDLAIFVEIGLDISGQDTGASGRGNRYIQLFDSFKESPIFGVIINSDLNAYGYYANIYQYDNIFQVEGTHLHWMNKMTISGIIGILIFLSIPIYYLNMMLRNIKGELKYTFIISSIAFLSYGLFKTIDGREAWFAFYVILPGIIYLPLVFKKHDNCNC